MLVLELAPDEWSAPITGTNSRLVHTVPDDDVGDGDADVVVVGG